MKISRRIFLGGVAACAFSNHAYSADQVVLSGWHTLRLGAGGLITGFDIAPDGAMVCRTDTYGCYRWSGNSSSVANPGDSWIQLVTPSTMPARSAFAEPLSCYELAIAHARSSRMAMILSNSTGAKNWAVYISNDSGATWKNTGLFMLNADGNSPTLQKGASAKIVFDPSNADVVYVGMPKNSGNSYGFYRSIDGGETFTPITSIAAPTLDPGCTAMCFDFHYGTTTVNGQLRTKRLLVPVGGQGLWETLDGGQTFTEVGNAALKAVSVYQAQMDYDGVYYCNNNAGTTQGFIWRYSGPGGTWVQLDAQPGWKRNGGWLRNAAGGAGWLGNAGILIVDPRKGHQGFVSASGPNGLGNGFTSLNANAADPTTVTWSGATGGQVPKLIAPSYDVAWLNHGIQGKNSFIGAPNAIIDQNGVEWWCGNQGFWFFDQIPNYGVSSATTSNAVTRGIEQTVTTNVCKPPGATYPILGCQDMGILTGGFTQYPSDYYVSGARMDCYSLDWAATDPSFMVAKVDVEWGSHHSAYSKNYGLTGSWVPYSTQPDTMWAPAATGGGQIVAVDQDHHICIGGSNGNLKFQPVYTANATSASCSWKFCSGLPAWNWMHGGFGSFSKPFAVDRVNIGTVYAVAVDDSNPVVASTIYRSSDSGATWSKVGAQQIGAGGNFTNVFLYTVPGHPGHLWLASGGTSGGGNGLWRSTDGGATWTTIKPPVQYLVVAHMALGAPHAKGAYPTLYVEFTYGYQQGSHWYKSINQGTTWTPFVVDRSVLPSNCAYDAISNFSADWDTHGRLYFGTYGAGFAYYSP